jgi:hypothetical protein
MLSPPGHRQRSARALPKLLFGANLLLSLGVLLATAMLPAAGAQSVIVIPRPFGPDAATIVAQAQGVLVRSGMGGAMLARGDAPDFIERLYANGALMVLDGRTLQGCAS